jgi:hypothetical protein
VCNVASFPPISGPQETPKNPNFNFPQKDEIKVLFCSGFFPCHFCDKCSEKCCENWGENWTFWR